MLRYFHYSQAMLVRPIRSVDQNVTADRFIGKPTGLWLSAERDGGDDGWADWCIAEHWGTERLVKRAEVFLRPGHRVLHIDTPNGVLEFARRYFTPPRPGDAHDLALSYFRSPDWRKVAIEHQGVIIAPYAWQLRLDPEVSWYYGWDCASGCVWDADAIERVIYDETWKLPVGEQ